MEFKIVTATRRIAGLNKRLRCVQGGTSASKTISILIGLIEYAQKDKQPTLTSVVSESIPHLQKGCIRDFKNILKAQNYWKDDNWAETGKIYTFETGSQIEFFGADQADKLRGGRRDRLFINECNNVSFSAFEELEVRTKEFVYLDWNPVAAFWYDDEIKNKRTDYDFLIVNYMDNEAIDEQTRASIEQRRSRAGWWKVYGLGELGEIEGKIYSDWQIIDKVPHEARLERYGLDFGYTCLSGDTLVATEDGNRRIDEVKEGDRVLTRRGYKKVIWAGSRGLKYVYRIDFGLDKHIIATDDHRVFTKDGWKEVIRLSNRETICELKQNLTEESIKDIQKESIPIIFTTKAEKKIGYYIETFTKSFLAKYRQNFVYTTLIKIHSTIIQKILLPFQTASITKYITQIISEESQMKRGKRYAQESVFHETTGMIEGESQWSPRREGLKSVFSVVGRLFRQIPIKSFVGLFVERKRTQEKIQENILVNFAEKSLYPQPITRETPALRSVQVNLQSLKEKIEVFDLTVEDEHEFFANGILVHNCDPTAIVAVYYYNGGYILDEILFQKGLSNKQIADIILNQKKTLTVADSAEPKSIDEIRSYGVNIIGAEKGKDSVKHGIQMVQDQQISMTKNSTNLIKAYRNYLWMVDKDGRVLNEPDHAYSDIMDATRYAFTSLVPYIRKRDFINSLPKIISKPSVNQAR